MAPTSTTYTTTLPESSADVEITTTSGRYLYALTDTDGRGESYVVTPVEEYDSEEATDVLDSDEDESRYRTGLPDLVAACDWAVSNFGDEFSMAFLREEDDGSFTAAF